MADVAVRSKPADRPFKGEIPQSIKGEGSKYLAQVSEFVSMNRHTTSILKNPAGSIFTFGHLEDTDYRDESAEVNGWKKFYLPDIVDMRVFGTVRGVPCQIEQAVLMTCEDTKVYAFDGCELHLVAESLKQLFNQGLTYPGSTSYDKGDAFKHMDESDWAEIRNGPVGKRLDQQHKKLVQENKAQMLKFLKSCHSS